ncbi:MAG: hypothetical protein GXO83_07330 [Chlorobi bacterium]|nr:hypothetical protein [Chlorobiota bacterium]
MMTDPIEEQVRSDASGYKTVDYAKMTAILVEAIKQQQKMIEDQKERIDKLERILN